MKLPPPPPPRKNELGGGKGEAVNVHVSPLHLQQPPLQWYECHQDHPEV